eukprot:9890278-Lingulodinium_polyedra.AAC.1
MDNVQRAPRNKQDNAQHALLSPDTHHAIQQATSNEHSTKNKNNSQRTRDKQQATHKHTNNAEWQTA